MCINKSWKYAGIILPTSRRQNLNGIKSAGPSNVNSEYDRAVLTSASGIVSQTFSCTKWTLLFHSQPSQMLHAMVGFHIHADLSHLSLPAAAGLWSSSAVSPQWHRQKDAGCGCFQSKHHHPQPARPCALPLLLAIPLRSPGRRFQSNALSRVGLWWWFLVGTEQAVQESNSFLRVNLLTCAGSRAPMMGQIRAGQDQKLSSSLRG